MLRDVVPVEYPRPDASIAGDQMRLVDLVDVQANDWLATNQFTVIEGAASRDSAGAIQHNRRPDIILMSRMIAK